MSEIAATAATVIAAAVTATSTTAVSTAVAMATYLVDAGPNEARKRMRDTMAPLNHKTQASTYPLISHWEFPTVVTG